MKILAFLLLLLPLAGDDKSKTFKEPLDRVFAACIKVAGDQHVIDNIEKEVGILTFRSGKSFTSNGFRVSVSVTKDDEGNVKVKLNTQKIGMQFIGWGAGGRLAKKYLAAVEKELKKGP